MLETSADSKAAGRHQYLDYLSFQPEHVKCSVNFSRVLRIKRLSSEEKDFEDCRFQMKSYLLKREHPELTEKKLRNVWFSEAKIQTLGIQICIICYDIPTLIKSSGYIMSKTSIC